MCPRCVERPPVPGQRQRSTEAEIFTFDLPPVPVARIRASRRPRRVLYPAAGQRRLPPGLRARPDRARHCLILLSLVICLQVYWQEGAETQTLTQTQTQTQPLSLSRPPSPAPLSPPLSLTQPQTHLLNRLNVTQPPTLTPTTPLPLSQLQPGTLSPDHLGASPAGSCTYLEVLVEAISLGL